MKTDWKKTRFSWDESFIAHALIAAYRSSCRQIHTGCVIVKNKRIIASGYNGRAPGFEENCLEDRCEKQEQEIEALNMLTCLGSHAETNALLQPTLEANKRATIYSVYSPCYACAKQIAAAEIAEIVYLKPYEKELAAVKKYFSKINAGKKVKTIKLRKLKLENEILISLLQGLIGSS